MEELEWVTYETVIDQSVQATVFHHTPGRLCRFDVSFSVKSDIRVGVVLCTISAPSSDHGRRGLALKYTSIHRITFRMSFPIDHKRRLQAFPFSV